MPLRYGIIADIHANLAAFEAVLADMGPVDMLWCLGDLVGYGPDPNECIERLQGRTHECVMGNHDLAALGRLDISEFNREAAAAVEWTASTLTETSRLYLSGRPERVLAEPFTLVHGSPRQPIWEYITHEGRAAPNFDHFDTQGCLVGHTHVPALWLMEPNRIHAVGRIPGPGDHHSLAEARIIANPGSVGQPRDGDPRAAYALFDSDSARLEWRRVPYRIEVTQERMRRHRLPERLVERLAYGY